MMAMTTPVIKVAAANPPTNKPPPAADVSVRALQSVQALVTVTDTPSMTVKENGTCPTILSAMTEAVSEPSSFEYCMVAE